ncbi:hypothetical protein [Streptomyces arenae]|nr:hypothetical protein [Streptomyces arenae]
MYGLYLACSLLDLACVYVVFTVRRAERRAAGTGGHPRMALPA